MHNIFISCKESRIENNRSFYGCFNIGPFDSSQSLTIGNALRRTLLSECSGLGITSVIIDNVSHEYSTLPGMRESVLDLLLNLKEIVFAVKSVVPTALNLTTNLNNVSYPLPLRGSVRSPERVTTLNPEGAAYTRVGVEVQANKSDFLQNNKAIEIRRKNLLINNMSSVFTEDFNLFKTTRSVCPNPEPSNSSVMRGDRGSKPFLIKSKDIFNLLISKRKHLKKPLIGYLKVKGPGIIRARDLKLPPFIQCVDGNQYIATLAEDGFLSMKFVLMEGKGYIIQKNQSFMSSQEHPSELQSLPNQLITKRADFVNQIEKNLNINTLQGITPSGFSTQPLRGSGVISKDTGLQTAKALSELEIEKQKNNYINILNSLNTSNNANNKTQKKFINNDINFNSQPLSPTTTNFLNCKPLNLDCVFNPITKVSYIIEDFDNKLINDFNYRFNFANDVSSLIESSYYLQNLNLFNKHPFGVQNEKTNFNQSKPITEHQFFSQNIVNLVDSYSKDEIQDLLTYLSYPYCFGAAFQPSQKSKTLHNIVLEIWTNGAVHPREALTTAFQNLTSLFLNLNKV